jgi:hypothetical protein
MWYQSLTTVSETVDKGQADNSRRFSMKDRIPVAGGTALSIQQLDWGCLTRNCVSIPLASTRHFFLLWSVLKGYTAHPAFYSVVTGSSFPGGKTAWVWSWLLSLLSIAKVHNMCICSRILHMLSQGAETAWSGTRDDYGFMWTGHWITRIHSEVMKEPTEKGTTS